nr:hypothetical protein PHYPA_000432 [Physcomitrium patens]
MAEQLWFAFVLLVMICSTGWTGVHSARPLPEELPTLPEPTLGKLLAWPQDPSTTPNLPWNPPPPPLPFLRNSPPPPLTFPWNTPSPPNPVTPWTPWNTQLPPPSPLSTTPSLPISVTPWYTPSPPPSPLSITLAPPSIVTPWNPWSAMSPPPPSPPTPTLSPPMSWTQPWQTPPPPVDSTTPSFPGNKPPSPPSPMWTNPLFTPPPPFDTTPDSPPPPWNRPWVITPSPPPSPTTSSPPPPSLFTLFASSPPPPPAGQIFPWTSSPPPPVGPIFPWTPSPPPKVGPSLPPFGLPPGGPLLPSGIQFTFTNFTQAWLPQAGVKVTWQSLITMELSLQLLVEAVVKPIMVLIQQFDPPPGKGLGKWGWRNVLEDSKLAAKVGATCTTSNESGYPERGMVIVQTPINNTTSNAVAWFTVLFNGWSQTTPFHATLDSTPGTFGGFVTDSTLPDLNTFCLHPSSLARRANRQGLHYVMG